MGTKASTGIPCPACGCVRADVKDSRQKLNWRQRRRKCIECAHVFTTLEMPTEAMKEVPRLLRRLEACQAEQMVVLAELQRAGLPRLDTED